MKLWRYRKPSVKSILGITKAKKRAKKKLGITTATKPLRAPKNLERRVKRKAGWYSWPVRLLRYGLPSWLGSKSKRG
ncbi:MAG: hypothetical protein FJ008_09755 [Chloroflexi bacterium]|nr:hypothetical protein [Chloroflexota bacterium]